jgi:hypothetical protein
MSPTESKASPVIGGTSDDNMNVAASSPPTTTQAMKTIFVVGLGMVGIGGIKNSRMTTFELIFILLTSSVYRKVTQLR